MFFATLQESVGMFCRAFVDPPPVGGLNAPSDRALQIVCAKLFHVATGSCALLILCVGVIDFRSAVPGTCSPLSIAVHIFPAAQQKATCNRDQWQYLQSADSTCHLTSKAD